MPTIDAVAFGLDLVLFACFSIAAWFFIFRTSELARFMVRRAPCIRWYDSLGQRVSHSPPWRWLWNGDDWETFRAGIADQPERYPRVLGLYRISGFVLALPALMLAGVVSVVVAIAIVRG